jgi:uncharacterized protein (TIGR03435 family)
VFEVASIRANTIGGPGKKVGDSRTPVGTGGVMTPQGTQWRALNATIRTLIRFAYGSDNDPATPALLEEYRVVGGPSWIATEAYDVVARMPDAPRALGDSALMLQALLAERFALRVHSETRELPAYALVRARRDGLWGDAMRRTSGMCVPATERVGRGDQVPCGIRGGFMGLSATGATMTRLAVSLTPIVGRPVIDQTGLDGAFDFILRFSADGAVDSRFPLIFTALQEQLGLRLESGRASVQILVIDHVERSTEN